MKIKHEKDLAILSSFGDLHIKVDKSHVDSPNLLFLMIDIKEHDGKTSYKCATRDGILNKWLSRHQFDINKQKILNLESINSEKEFNIRTANSLTSLSGGQGMVHCNC